MKFVLHTDSSLFDGGVILKGELRFLMRPVAPTEEAGVCVLGLRVDHEALTHCDRPMFGEDDDFIPHHMFQLEVSVSLAVSRSCFRGSPPPPPLPFPRRTSRRGQFSKCDEHRTG